MPVGDLIQVFKHSHDGRRPVGYPGRLVHSAPDWIVVEATWAHGFVACGELTFQNGDSLTEYYSHAQPYNAFRIHRPGHGLVGWYCNVTGPLRVSDGEIHWHDRFIDVVLMPDGRLDILDEDELEQAGVASSDPGLYQEIIAGRDELVRQIRAGAYPFSTTALNGR